MLNKGVEIALEEVAKFNWLLYKKYTEQGFSESQALKLVSRTGVNMSTIINKENK